MWGDSIKPSLYAAHMGVNVTCRRLCNPRTYDAKEMQAFQKRIEEGYRGHLILDNLPVSEVSHIVASFSLCESSRASYQYIDIISQQVFTQKIKGFRSFMLGYPLGTPKTTGKQKKSKLPLPVVPVTILNNHLALTIKYNRPEDLVTSSTKGFRIVGFHVCFLVLGLQRRPARHALCTLSNRRHCIFPLVIECPTFVMQVVAHSYKHDETTCVMDDRKNVGWFPKPGNPVTVEDKDPVVWSYSITWLKVCLSWNFLSLRACRADAWSANVAAHNVTLPLSRTRLWAGVRVGTHIWNLPKPMQRFTGFRLLTRS